MKTDVFSVEMVQMVHLSRLPNGVYRGIWGGYEVRVVIDGVHYKMKTENGIRTPKASCIVTIEDGKVTVETLAKG